MNKLVYLAELDSVRNSEEEIKIGQQKLFQEIVLRGNSVVLTFNQLTDSYSILSMLKNEESYLALLNLFKMGSIKISNFGKVFSASQYIQEGLRRCIADDSNSFVFSCLPIKSNERDLQILAAETLAYSNFHKINLELEKINEKIDKAENQAVLKTLTNEKNRLIFIIRYLRLLIEISMEELSNNPPKTSSFDSLYQILSSYMESNLYDGNRLLEDALSIIHRISNKLRKEEPKFLNNRSKWVEAFYDESSLFSYDESAPSKGASCNHFSSISRDASESLRLGISRDESELYSCEVSRDSSGVATSEPIFMANAIIDICYNFACENSIEAISLPYDIHTRNELLHREILSYWDSYKNGNHRFDFQPPDIMETSSKMTVPWNTAVRVIKSTNYRLEHDLESDISQMTESQSEKNSNSPQFESSSWWLTVAKGMVRHFAATVFYVFIFMIIEGSINFADGYLQDLHWFPNYIYDIVGIVTFGIVASLIAKKTGVPDILDSLYDFGLGIFDVIVIIKENWKVRKNYE